MSSEILSNHIYCNDSLTQMREWPDESFGLILTSPPYNLKNSTGNGMKGGKGKWSSIFYNHKWRVQKGILQDRQDIVADFPVRQIIIWQRSGGMNFNKGYFLPTYEVIYLIAKPDFVLAPQANKHGDVWQITQARGNPHPAPFPVELADRVVSSTTAERVLDPFMGSGTTAIAARNCGRDWVGIELSQEYVDMASNRITDHVTQPSIF